MNIYYKPLLKKLYKQYYLNDCYNKNQEFIIQKLHEWHVFEYPQILEFKPYWLFDK
jgi:hypothetical protein